MTIYDYVQETCLPANSTMLVLGTNQNVQKCFHI